jgi:hypothetical protein
MMPSQKRPLTPDDPRHGTYAGYMAHRKEGTTGECAPCRHAGTRERKLANWRKDHNIKLVRHVRLGEEAFEILKQSDPRSLAAAAGLHVSCMYKLRRLGPDATVERSTRDAIRSAGFTQATLACARRLQALTAIGYSMFQLAKHTTILTDNALRKIRSGNAVYVQAASRAEINRVYDLLHMTPAPPGRGASRCRVYAKRMGWAAPLAWDNIDDPRETPVLDDVAVKFDEAAVLRRMAGDRSVKVHAAESEEVVRRLAAQGYGHGWIEEHTGIKAVRFKEAYKEGRTAYTRGEVA